MATTVTYGKAIAKGRATGQTGAVATVVQHTVGSSDASFMISHNILITTATTFNFSVTCAYTDEGNTARTATLSFVFPAGGALGTSIANASGAVPAMGIPQRIRAKAGTTITIAKTGTFTAVVYNVEALIEELP